MKKLFLFLTATILSLTASAQGWTVPTSQAYDKEHVIYATIDGMTANDDYTVGAFIGDECRAIESIKRDVTGAPSAPLRFELRVKGSASDAGKNITFKIFDASIKSTYSLAQTLAYAPEGTTGMPSNLYKLNFTKATGYTYEEQSVDLYPGSTYDIKYKAVPDGAQLPDDFDSKFYAVQNTAIISLSGKTVTAVAIGIAEVINESGVSCTNTNSAVTIRVVEKPVPVTSITIDNTKATTLYVGDEINLSEYFTVNPSNATNKNVTVTANNNNVSIVESAAANMFTLTATGKGTSVVTIASVEAPSIKATITFNIKKHVERISQNNSANFTINVGDQINLADYYVINPTDADDKTVTVDATKGSEYVQLGVTGTTWTLKAIKKGEASISVTSVDNPKAKTTLDFTINQPATSITVSPNSFDIAVGEELDCGNNMEIKVLPADADQNYTLSTANTDIVEVHNPGARGAYIVGLKKGTATVTVTAADGSGVSTTFTVNVYPALQGFSVTHSEITMPTQSKTQIAIVPNPQDALVRAEDAPVFAITAPAGQPNGWKYVEGKLTRDDTNDGTIFVLDLTAYSMGEGSLFIGCGNYLSENIPLHVGFQYNLANGWNWMSVFTDNNSTAKETMQQMLGNNLVEARTQTGLLYNDPKFDYFGDFTDFADTQTMYKIKGKAAVNYTLYGDYLNIREISLDKGWNWIAYNSEYNQTVSDYFKNGVVEGDVVLSLEDGFATYDGTKWTGSLTTLKGGKGYMYYHTTTSLIGLSDPYEVEQPATIGTAQARSFEQKFWNYNPREYNSIMPIIAEIEGYNSSEYTVGAFVGNECRGEGRFVDGKWFITVAGEGGETVSFRIYNKVTGSTVNVENTVKMTSILGSAKAPVKMNVGIATVINNAEMNITDSNAWYNLNGQKVTTPQKGIFINNGRKVLVK